MGCLANLFGARRKVAIWNTECSKERPHSSSLGYRTPVEFARGYNPVRLKRRGLGPGKAPAASPALPQFRWRAPIGAATIFVRASA